MSRIRHRIDRAWFCLLLQHLVRRQIWSILSTLQPHGTQALHEAVVAAMTIMIRNSLSRLTASFPSGRGLAGTRMSIILDLLKLKTMEVLVTTGATICAKLQSNRSKIAQTLKKLNWMVVKLCRLEEIQYWMTICSLYNERSSWQRHTVDTNRQTDRQSDRQTKSQTQERTVP